MDSEVTGTKKSAWRNGALKFATVCCIALGVGAAPVNAAGAWAPDSHKASMKSTASVAFAASELKCYATARAPDSVTCYRSSWKTEFRHGELVYIPMLIQVPTPANPPHVAVVDSLDDIGPG